MPASILGYSFVLLFVALLTFQQCKRCRTYFIGGPSRLVPAPVKTFDFILGVWIVLVILLFTPNLLSATLSWVNQEWLPWIKQTLLQSALAISLVILFHTMLKSWGVWLSSKPSDHTALSDIRNVPLKRNLLPICFLWFVLSLVLFFLIHIAWSALMLSLGVEAVPQETLVESVTSKDPVILTSIFISVVILAPIWEELFFRGLLFNYLNSKTGFWSAAIISGFLFSIMHSILTGVGGLWALGIMFALAYRITADIRVPILVHALYNLNTLIVSRAFIDPSHFNEIAHIFLNQ